MDYTKHFVVVGESVFMLFLCVQAISLCSGFVNAVSIIFVSSKCVKSGQSSVSVLTVRPTVVRWHPGLAGDCRLERVVSFLSNSALRDVTKVPQERQHGGAALIQHRPALLHNHADEPSLTLLGLSRSPGNRSIKPPGA